MSGDGVFNHCKTCSAYGIDISVDIDNPGNFYCVKCWEAYDADVAYHHGIHLVKENRFLSTHNAALAITVANVLADMDKMKERADRHWKETSCLEQKIKDLEALLEHKVEYLNFARIRELENEVDNYDSWLGGSRQNERELHAQIGELEAQIERLHRDNYSSDDKKSLFSNSEDNDGSRKCR